MNVYLYTFRPSGAYIPSSTVPLPPSIHLSFLPPSPLLHSILPPFHPPSILPPLGLISPLPPFPLPSFPPSLLPPSSLPPILPSFHPPSPSHPSGAYPVNLGSDNPQFRHNKNHIHHPTPLLLSCKSYNLVNPGSDNEILCD